MTRSTPALVDAALAQWEASGARGLPPAQILRTRELLPDNLLDTPEGDGELIELPMAARLAAVEYVTGMRSRLTKQTPAPANKTGSKRGRFLALTVDQSDASSAPMGNTHGLFSVWDTPPWDLWLAYVVPDKWPEGESYLVSWIPPTLVSLADIGVRVNPLKCLWWLDSRDNAFARDLNIDGLL
jgi:hypothetical protein